MAILEFPFRITFTMPHLSFIGTLLTKVYSPHTNQRGLVRLPWCLQSLRLCYNSGGVFSLRHMIVAHYHY